MSISDGQQVKASVVNAALASKTSDNTLSGKQTLSNADAASGSTVTNVQKEINGIEAFTGRTPGDTYDSVPTWDSDAIGVANESIKDRVDAVQAQVEQNDSDIDTKMTKVGTSVDNTVPRYNGVAGEVQTSGVTIDDSNNVTGVNDLTVTGNLTVNGTSTTINTATLDVEDVNITVNNNGDQATADGVAGLTVEMSDATDVKIIYDSTATSRFKVGDSASEVEIATISGQQVVTNKDIDGGTASNTSRITLPKNTTAGLAALTDKEGTIAYDTTLNKPFYNDGSNWQEMGGGGSGVGGINYFDNPFFESNNTGIAVSNDTVVMVSAETTNPIRGTRSIKISTTSSALTSDNFVFNLDDIDLADQYKSKAIYVSFEYTTDANYTDDDYQIYVNSTTGGNVALINDDDGYLKATGGTTTVRKFVGKFFTNTTDVVYQIVARVQSAPASTSNIVIDNFTVSPDSFIPGAIITNWKPFTPTFSNGPTATLTEWEWKRDGEDLLIRGALNATGTGGAGVFGLQLSSINPNITISTQRNVGTATTYQVDGAAGYEITNLFGSSAEEIQLFDLGSGSLLVGTKITSGDLIYFDARVKVNEWSAGASISTTEALFKSAKLRVSGTPTNAISTTWTDVDFPTADEDDFNLYNTSGEVTIPETGWYAMRATLESGHSSGTAITLGARVHNKTQSVTYDTARTSGDSATTSSLSVQVVSFFKANKDDVIAIQSWSNGTSNTWSNTFTGSKMAMTALPDFSTFSVWGETEVVESIVPSAAAAGSANTWMNFTTLELSPGRYDLEFQWGFTNTGAVTNTGIQLAISEYSGTTTTDHVTGDNVMIFQNHQVSGGGDGFYIYKKNVEVTSATTYYFKNYLSVSLANMNLYGKATARKVQ